MKKLQYVIFLSLIWLFNRMPFFIMYRVSDFCYFLIYHVVKYRKKVVFDNLRNAFPQKSETEITQIAKCFYRHFCDLVFETAKGSHISVKELDKRFKYKNIELLNETWERGQDICLISGHYGNWEWMINFPLQSRYSQPLAIYQPLKDNFSEWWLCKTRSRHGAVMVPIQDVYKEIIKRKQTGQPVISWYLGDQRPPVHAKFWTTFLEQETAFHLGTEKIASKTAARVIFMDIHKTKRGYYEVEFTPLFDNAALVTEEHLITLTHVKHLERIISEQPSFWLWSHKRWKHKRPIDTKIVELVNNQIITKQ